MTTLKQILKDILDEIEKDPSILYKKVLFPRLDAIYGRSHTILDESIDHVYTTENGLRVE